jgi:hypothetical protein
MLGVKINEAREEEADTDGAKYRVRVFMRAQCAMERR